MLAINAVWTGRRAAYTHMHAMPLDQMLVYRCSSSSMIALAFATVDRRPTWMQLAAGTFHTRFDERRWTVYPPTIASPHDELLEEPVCEPVCSGAKTVSYTHLTLPTKA